MNRTLAAIVSGAAAVALLAGCGSSASDPASAETATTVTASSETATTSAAPTAKPKPTRDPQAFIEENQKYEMMKYVPSEKVGNYVCDSLDAGYSREAVDNGVQRYLEESVIPGTPSESWPSDEGLWVAAAAVRNMCPEYRRSGN